MKKVIIIGCPGSGKSTFGKKLKSVTGLPLYHLDMMYWNDDKSTVDKPLFLNRLQNVMSKPYWIIDGNYISTMEMRIMECDTIFFLDYGRLYVVSPYSYNISPPIPNLIYVTYYVSLS